MKTITQKDILENEGKVIYTSQVKDLDYYGDGTETTWNLIVKCGGHKDFTIYIGEPDKPFSWIESFGKKCPPYMVEHIFDFEPGVLEMFRW